MYFVLGPGALPQAIALRAFGAIGYIVLEQSQAAVDMLGHRLVPIKHIDLKKHYWEGVC